jgi:glycosyltransferase involved in cell wall biosynthesis
VVATFRRPSALQRCLRALAEQTRSLDQIIVVCRGDDEVSTKAAASLAREFPIQIVTCEEPRLCAQMDSGVAHAIGDVVAFTDDDSEPPPEWAARLMSLYAAADVGAAGGRDVIRVPDVDSRPTTAPVGTVTRTGRPRGNHHKEGVGVRDVDFLKGVNLSVRRQLWHIDSKLLGDGNQSHWELGTCLRIRRLGWRVLYDAELVVDHYPDVRVGEPPRHSRDTYSLQRDAHNELYELIRWLPWWQGVAATARALLIGSRGTPGLAIAVWLAAHGTDPRQAFREIRATSTARWRAITARPRRGRWDAPLSPAAYRAEPRSSS